jgi:hypothetical protein
MMYDKTIKICAVTHFPTLLLTAADTFSFPSHFPPFCLRDFCGHCKPRRATVIAPGTLCDGRQAGPVLGAIEMGGRGGAVGWRQGQRILFANLSPKLINEFNKRPVSPVLALFSRTSLHLFDLS